MILFGCVRKKLKFRHERVEREKNSVTVLDDNEERERKEDSKTRVYFSSIVLMVFLMFTFYLMIVFSPPGFFHDKQGLVTWFFISAIVVLAIVRPLEEGVEVLRTKISGLPNRLERLLAKLGHEENWTWGRIGRCVLTFIITPLVMVWIFWSVEFYSQIRDMLAGGGYWYFIFASMAGLVVWFIDRLKEHFHKHRLNLKLEFWTMMLPISLTFSYLAVLSFAYHVYPYIPVERGGGDYTAESASILTFDAQLSNSIPSEVFDSAHTNLQSKKAIILDETANAIFITIPKSTNSTDVIKEIGEWRNNTPDSRPQKIFIIKREAVVSERTESW